MKTEFKIGDKVICNQTWIAKNSANLFVYSGAEYTIKYIYENGNITLEETGGVYVPSWFDPKQENKSMNNKKIAIKVGDNQELSRIVQEFLFSKGYKWAFENNTVRDSPCKKYGRRACVAIGWEWLEYSPDYFYSENDYAIYDAATQFGEIITLLSEPPKPVIKIKNDIGAEYEADFEKNPGYITFGCAKIDKKLLVDLYDLWGISYGDKEAKNLVEVKIGRGIFAYKDIKAIVEHPDFSAKSN